MANLALGDGGPPVDDQLNLSVADVEACLWWLWTKHFGPHFAAPINMMPVRIETSLPATPDLPASPDGRAKKFLEDLQGVLKASTGFQANIAFASFKSHMKGDKTWGQFAALVHSKAIYVAGIQRAKALASLSPVLWS